MFLSPTAPKLNKLMQYKTLWCTQAVLYMWTESFSHWTQKRETNGWLWAAWWQEDKEILNILWWNNVSWGQNCRVFVMWVSTQTICDCQEVSAEGWTVVYSAFLILSEFSHIWVLLIMYWKEFAFSCTCIIRQHCSCLHVVKIFVCSTLTFCWNWNNNKDFFLDICWSEDRLYLTSQAAFLHESPTDAPTCYYWLTLAYQRSISIEVELERSDNFIFQL